jgi:hypothetical protein
MQEHQTQASRDRALYRSAWLVGLVVVIFICHLGKQ